MLRFTTHNLSASKLKAREEDECSGVVLSYGILTQHSATPVASTSEKQDAGFSALCLSHLIFNRPPR